MSSVIDRAAKEIVKLERLLELASVTIAAVKADQTKTPFMGNPTSDQGITHDKILTTFSIASRLIAELSDSIMDLRFEMLDGIIKTMDTDTDKEGVTESYKKHLVNLKTECKELIDSMISLKDPASN